MSQVRPGTYVSGLDTPALERVKGIEPSYSAWKAAALPLSYTRDTGSLTRPGGGLNCPRGALSPAFRPLRTGLVPPGPPALNSGGVAAYIEVSRNQRKEVIQCLLPSAVTSLGSPAKLSIRAWHRGALSPGPASKRSGATGSPRRAFSFEDFSPTSKAVDREHGRALAAAALGNALAATLDRAAVIAAMAGLVVQVAIF